MQFNFCALIIRSSYIFERTLFYELSRQLCIFSCPNDISWKQLFVIMYADFGRYISDYAEIKAAWNKIEAFTKTYTPAIYDTLNGNCSFCDYFTGFRTCLLCNSCLVRLPCLCTQVLCYDLFNTVNNETPAAALVLISRIILFQMALVNGSLICWSGRAVCVCRTTSAAPIAFITDKRMPHPT